MFLFDKDIVDITILFEGFSLSNLWMLREELMKKVENLDDSKETYINFRDAFALQEIETKTKFLETNIYLIEEVMVAKENEIFEFLICNPFCLN